MASRAVTDQKLSDAVSGDDNLVSAALDAWGMKIQSTQSSKLVESVEVEDTLNGFEKVVVVEVESESVESGGADGNIREKAVAEVGRVYPTPGRYRLNDI